MSDNNSEILTDDVRKTEKIFKIVLRLWEESCMFRYDLDFRMLGWNHMSIDYNLNKRVFT